MGVTIHDFRVTDSVLAKTEPDAGDVVYLGPAGNAAFPFVISRRLSGPGGMYMDAAEITGPDLETIAFIERKYELDGESILQDIVDELTDVVFPGPGKYTLQYFVYDDLLLEVPFEATQSDPPYGAVVPGPVDAALSKSTIAWLGVSQDDGSEVTKPIWYGYEQGRVYVLTGTGEQDIPGLAGSSKHVRLIVRSKDVQSRVGDVTCVSQTMPKDKNWERIARELLLGRRLNLHDGDKAVDRWKKDCEIVMLTPVITPVES
ncbi:MAG: hypothetical protein ACRDJ1_00835 [Actinomycetota bacterium]